MSKVHEIMMEFSSLTGLSPAAKMPRRYLWRDAFAVSYSKCCAKLPTIRNERSPEALSGAEQVKCGARLLSETANLKSSDQDVTPSLANDPGASLQGYT